MQSINKMFSFIVLCILFFEYIYFFCLGLGAFPGFCWLHHLADQPCWQILTNIDSIYAEELVTHFAERNK